MIVHQLLMGSDIATDSSNPVHSMAASMANFAYLVEYEPHKAFAVDAAWDVDGFLDYAKSKGLEVTTAVFTHRHLDHTGGRVNLRRAKVAVPGLAELVAAGITVRVGKDDVEATSGQTEVPASTIKSLRDGDEIVPGARVLHTPGHTPGSICILLNDGDSLITGDTLFIGNCGRTDLPESDPDAMMNSLARLSKLPPTCKVLPGHNYAALKNSTIGREKQINFAMREAMNYVSPNATSATIRTSPLPDYIAAAREALYKHCEEEDH